MTKRSGSKKPVPRIPNFRSEAEEAAWWDANEDYIIERLKKYGRVVGPLKVKQEQPATKAISIRIPVDGLERAQAIAEQKGIGYQTVLKDAIRKGLRTTAG
jgi:predicted DNA binding CopG/RHH family protein